MSWNKFCIFFNWFLSKGIGMIYDRKVVDICSTLQLCEGVSTGNVVIMITEKLQWEAKFITTEENEV